MNNQQAYNTWAKKYDTVKNKTRDLEAIALRQSVPEGMTLDILEIGCGTGKNTEWLKDLAKSIVGADFSQEMLNKAKDKLNGSHITFKQMDLRENWQFGKQKFDLITCSLVLEHIENLDFIFQQAYKVLRKGGRFYIGEYHPFKQYQGKKAEFETENGIFELECFVHHTSEFFQMAKKNGFVCEDLKEWFDEGVDTPRILSMVFKK